MSALAIGALLRGAGRWISAALRWLFADPLRLLLVSAVACWAWLLLITLPDRNATIADQVEMIAARTGERDREKSAHQQTKRDYAAAQLAARVLEEKRLARVAAEQESITDDVTQDYRARLAAARSTAERLRHQLVQAGGGAGGAPAAVDLPGAGDAAGGAAASAGDRRLSFGTGELDWRLTATEQALQLDELINWVERQAAVDPNR